MCKVCGIEINGSDAVIVILEGTKGQFEIIKTKPLKIALADHSTQADIKSFYNTISEYFKTNSVASVLIKSGSIGKYSSGPAVFKIESIIQMMEVKVEFITSQAVAAYWKKVDLDISELDLLKYQQYAFKLAYYSLED